MQVSAHLALATLLLVLLFSNIYPEIVIRKCSVRASRPWLPVSSDLLKCGISQIVKNMQPETQMEFKSQGIRE